jgi:hypothetical protein
MAVTTEQPNTHVRSTEVRSTRHASDVWAHPENPEENTRPPGNGELDAQDTARSEEKLLAVLGS